MAVCCSEVVTCCSLVNFFVEVKKSYVFFAFANLLILVVAISTSFF